MRSPGAARGCGRRGCGRGEGRGRFARRRSASISPLSPALLIHLLAILTRVCHVCVASSTEKSPSPCSTTFRARREGNETPANRAQSCSTTSRTRSKAPRPWQSQSHSTRAPCSTTLRARRQGHRKCERAACLQFGKTETRAAQAIEKKTESNSTLQTTDFSDKHF